MTLLGASYQAALAQAADASRSAVRRALLASGGNVPVAAKALSMSRHSLYQAVRRLGLQGELAIIRGASGYVPHAGLELGQPRPPRRHADPGKNGA